VTQHTSRRGGAAALLILTAAAAFLTLSNSSSPVRPAVMVAFFCLVPGNALVGFLDLRPPSAALALGLGVSLALSTLCAQVMVWCGVWNPTAGLIVLVIVAAPCLVLQVLISPRQGKFG
jgi:uncharacterized membrane protein